MAGDNAAALVFFLFDLLYLDGEDLISAPLRERKARLQRLLAGDSTVFVDPEGCSRWLTERERVFESEFAKQRSVAPR